MLSTLPFLAITQRVAVDPATRERRDALDQRWAAFADRCGARIMPLPNHAGTARALLRASSCAGVILSGGNDVGPDLWSRGQATAAEPPAGSAPERDETEYAVLSDSLESGIPVLGVCRGFQAVHRFHAGRLTDLGDSHVAVRHPLVWTAPPDLLEPLPDHVNSFHRWGIRADDLPDGWLPLATHDGVVEMAQHATHRHAGIMWHPEREHPFRTFDCVLIRRYFGIGDVS